ncbi:MAG: protein kinase [Oscillospiraceae bacterium]|nr:protein kinase [Oscillospiraceae bacterium]
MPLDLKEKSLSGEILEERYRVGGRLGGGNFGTVYKADELQNGAAVREVALKLYSPEATAAGDIEGMFSDCALPAKILSSSAPFEIKRHFAQIYNWGIINTSIGKCAYVSIELIKNASTLEDLIERHNNSNHRPCEAEVLDKMRQFFAALAEAHKADVLHRDIKGANVMLSEGVVKIVDFGMGAAISAGNVALKTTMSIYAPENFGNGAEEKEPEYTKKSDIYQAGLMFYQYWTGVQPFEKVISQEEDEPDEDYNKRSMKEYLQMRIDWAYKNGASVSGCDDSPKLDAILSKCLKFSQSARYDDCEAVLKDINSDNISLARSALLNGNTQFAETIATSALNTAKTADKTELLWLLGDIKTKSENIKAAKDYYLEAYKLADENGVYFLNKPKMRALLGALADSFRDLNQKGMENLYRKKTDKFI